MAKATFESEPTTHDFLYGKTYVFWLDKMRPDPHRKDFYQVSVVVENESGHYPTGGDSRAPWYWDEETCEKANAERGFDKMRAWEIIMSSMFASNK